MRSVLCLRARSIRLPSKSKRAPSKSNRLLAQSRIFNEIRTAFQGNTCYCIHEDYHVILSTIFFSFCRSSLKRAGPYFCQAPVWWSLTYLSMRNEFIL